MHPRLSNDYTATSKRRMWPRRRLCWHRWACIHGVTDVSSCEPHHCINCGIRWEDR